MILQSGNNMIPVLTSTCPKCGHVNEPRGKAMTLAMTCTACKTYFHRGQWNDEEVLFKEVIEPVFPVGARGSFQGKTYIVLGFTVRRDRRYSYRWREYTLFNPVNGVAYLSEYDGHWNFITPIEGNPKGNTRGYEFESEGRTFRLYQKYKTEIVFASGEFFYDIFKSSDMITTEEYISPPVLLGCEYEPKSMLWYRGEYIHSSAVAAAFQVSEHVLPEQTGTGYTQPFFKARFSDTALVQVTALFAALLVAIQLLFSNWASQKVVYNQTIFTKDVATDAKMISSGPFTLSGGTKSVVVSVQSPIDNDWFYADFTLVNDNTGEEYNFSHEIGYYHGYEGGESWSEGANHGEAFLSRIPAGTYHINIYPQFSKSDYFSISIKHDVSPGMNLLFALLILCAFPIGYFIWKYYRERSRWSDSDYSPYDS